MTKRNALTADNFASVFLKTLDDKDVQEKLLSTFHDMIELMVIEKVEVVKKDYDEKLKSVKDAQKNVNDSLQREIDSLRKENMDLKQYSYREDLIVKGLDLGYSGAVGRTDESSSADVKHKVLELFNSKMGLAVDPGSISTAHQLPSGKKQPTFSNGRAQRFSSTKVIVRFNNRDVRNKVYESRMCLKHSSPALYIDEHLVEENGRLMAFARTLKKDGKIKGCWTRHCKLFVRLLNDKPCQFTSEADLMSCVHGRT